MITTGRKTHTGNIPRRVSATHYTDPFNNDAVTPIEKMVRPAFLCFLRS